MKKLGWDHISMYLPTEMLAFIDERVSRGRAAALKSGYRVNINRSQVIRDLIRVAMAIEKNSK